MNCGISLPMKNKFEILKKLKRIRQRKDYVHQRVEFYPFSFVCHSVCVYQPTRDKDVEQNLGDLLDPRS